jgi:hypothetical protein
MSGFKDLHSLLQLQREKQSENEEAGEPKLPFAHFHRMEVEWDWCGGDKTFREFKNRKEGKSER